MATALSGRPIYDEPPNSADAYQRALDAAVYFRASAIAASEAAEAAANIVALPTLLGGRQQQAMQQHEPHYRDLSQWMHELTATFTTIAEHLASELDFVPERTQCPDADTLAHEPYRA
jgi:hypothetical protein